MMGRLGFIIQKAMVVLSQPLLVLQFSQLAREAIETRKACPEQGIMGFIIEEASSVEIIYPGWEKDVEKCFSGPGERQSGTWATSEFLRLPHWWEGFLFLF